LSRRKSQEVEEKKKASSIKKEGPRQSAVLVPLCRIGDSVGLLYTKRSSALRSHAGQVSFPGGKCDGDETAVETAIRETCEELGLTSGDDVIDVWTQMPTVPGKGGKDLITPVVAQLKTPPTAATSTFDIEQLRPNRQEVDAVFVKKIGDLHNASACGYTQFRVPDPKAPGGSGSGGNGYSLPVYKTEPYKIWGLTAIITFQFLNVFLRKQPLGANQFFKHKINFQSPIRL